MSVSSAKMTPATPTLPLAWVQQLGEQAAPSGPDWLVAVRQKGIEALTQSARLPGRKDEHWKYFSLQGLEVLEPGIGWPVEPAAPGLQTALLDDIDAVHLVVGTGGSLGLSAELQQDLPKGLRLLTLQQAVAEAGLAEQIEALLNSENLAGPDRVFRAVNSASLDLAPGSTLVIAVDAGADVGRLHLDWQMASGGQARMDSFRLLVLQHAGSRLQLLESFPPRDEGNSNPAAVFNGVTQVQLAAKAELDHLRLQQAASTQHLFQSVEVNQAADSQYRYTGFELGGGLVRNELSSRLQGERASADLAAAFIGKGESTVDHHVLVDHVAPNGSSQQNFRGVLGDRSRGVWNGKAVIRPGADGSKVRQSNANLLLSDLAEMNTKPELEIYADEVEASHGATVGQLDELALFYMVSRGIGEADARRMLTGAFCRAIGNRLSDRVLIEQIEQRLDAAMPAASEEIS